MSRTAVVAGSTGLVGSELVEQLCHAPQYSRVVALTRRRAAPRGKLIESARAKLTEQCVDFAALPELPAGDYFCALGTTLKKAGSREAFRLVDYDYALAFARAAKQASEAQLLLVSAIGADEGSSIFYNRVKGDLEAAVLALGLARVTIFRPSLLLGARTERRLGERLGALGFRAIKPLLRGGLAKYQPVAADVLARAMLRTALDEHQRSHGRVLESDEIAALGAASSTRSGSRDGSGIDIGPS